MLKDLAKRAVRRVIPARLAADADRILEDVKTARDTLLRPDTRSLIKKHSKARLLLPLASIDETRIRTNARVAPRPTSVGIRDLDDKHYVYCDDGSLRNLNGRKTVLKARKAARKARKAAR